MPAPLLNRDEVLDRLLLTFRRDGFDGASLSTLSAATGLGRSSLYHHFPGGKVEMAEQVLARLGARLEATLLAPMRAGGPPSDRLDAMLTGLAAFYDDGRLACLLERLAASVDRARFRRPLSQVFHAWLAALEQLLLDAGIGPVEARARAEDTVARVEGALVLAAGLGDPTVFGRTLERVRVGLLAG